MPPVVAIGLDAAEPTLLDRWMAAGALPNLARLRDCGGRSTISNLHYYRAETAWTTFLTGVRPERTGYWTPLKYQGNYHVDNIGAFDFSSYPPFYVLGPDFRVAVVDLPQTRLAHGVNGIQVVAWGAHSALAPSESSPPNLLPELTARHGSHPALGHDEAPLYDGQALLALHEKLLTGIRRRTAICLDLLGRDRWDLFLTMFSETHSAGHYLWHLSQNDHPLADLARVPGRDPLLEVMQAIDDAIGAIAAAAPDATLVVYSGHGMEANSMDLPSMVFLPELMFRHSFPGRRGLTGAADDAPLPPPQRSLTRTCWEDELYALKHDGNPVRRWLRRVTPGDVFYRIERKLGWNTPPSCYRECSTLHYQPAWWYRSAWPEMQAFALPSFSEGYVRVNLEGREPRGIVRPSAYDRVCDEITTMLHQLRDPRSGRPLVREVLRTRTAPDADAPHLPEPDLIVSWAPFPTDVVDSPTLGRVGPVPYLRTGSHVERGFLLASGPGIAPGQPLPDGHALDLAPTILSLAGAPLPPHFEGRPLVGPQVAARRSQAVGSVPVG
jgi:predicted AlkP superfamily phosphohydrolase/phosphomutase